MPRAKRPSEATPAPEPGPHVIDPNAVYTIRQAQQALGLRRSTIAREKRERRLRVSKRAGRYFILGEWLLDWLKAGAKQAGVDA